MFKPDINPLQNNGITPVRLPELQLAPPPVVPKDLEPTPLQLPKFTTAPVPKQPQPVGIPETQSLKGMQLYDGEGKKIVANFQKDTEFEMTPHTAAGIINHILSTLPEGENVLKVGKQGVDYNNRSNIILGGKPIDLSLPAESLAKIRDVRMIMGTLSVVTVEGSGSSAKISFINDMVLDARPLSKKEK